MLSLARLEHAIVDDLEQPVRAIVAREFADLVRALQAAVAPKALESVVAEARALRPGRGKRPSDELAAMLAAVDALVCAPAPGPRT